MNTFNVFLLGVLMAGYAFVALYFARAWRDTRDRLFAAFALAFVIMSFNQLAFAILGEDQELHTPLYLVRLSAYVILAAAIVDKNMRR